MKSLYLACDGVTIGNLTIPSFEVQTGDIICLHMSGPAWTPDEKQLIQNLTGARAVPGMRLIGRIEEACPPLQPAGLRGLFYRPRAMGWVTQRTGRPRSECQDLLSRLGIRPDESIGRLPYRFRVLLGLEAAWAKGADVVVYCTVGLDPLSIQLIHCAISERLDRAAAIRLAYPSYTQGRFERNCFPGSRCIEVSLTRQEPQTTSHR